MYKDSAWNFYHKCDFWHCIFSQDYSEELVKHLWNNPLVIKNIYQITNRQSNLEEEISNYIVSIVPADDLASFDARPSADTMLTKLGSIGNTRLAHWELRIWNECHCIHDEVIKWKHFPCYGPFVWGIHWSQVNSPHKGQWRGALIFSLICAWINGWVNNREAGDLRCHRSHYNVTVMDIWYAVSPI